MKHLIGALSIIVAGTFLGGAESFAQTGDVCGVRPDLCGGKIKKKGKVKVGKRYTRKGPCRKSGRTRNPKLADLPVCGSETAWLAAEMEKDLIREQAARAPTKAELERRREMQYAAEAKDRHGGLVKAHSTSRRSRESSFNAYLNDNNANPILAPLAQGRGFQSAFADKARRAPASEPTPTTSATSPSPSSTTTSTAGLGGSAEPVAIDTAASTEGPASN